MGSIYVGHWRCRRPQSSIAEPSSHPHKKNWICFARMETKGSIHLLLFFDAMLDMVVETFVDLRIRPAGVSCRVADSKTYQCSGRVPRTRFASRRLRCAVLVYEKCSCLSQEGRTRSRSLCFAATRTTVALHGHHRTNKAHILRLELSTQRGDSACARGQRQSHDSILSWQHIAGFVTWYYAYCCQPVQR